MWDVFISHAAEDKDVVARPLAEALSRAGFRVWYDELTLSLGDSLNRSIDRGLAESRYGIVVLSPHFLAKEWPRRELDGLTAREVSAGKVILPVWHRVTREQIERFSPPLADKLGVSTERGIEHVAEQVAQVLRNGPAVAAGPPVRSSSRRGWLAAGAAVAGTGVLGIAWWRFRPDAAAAVAGRWVIDATRLTPRTYLEFRVAEGRISGTSEIMYSNHPDLTLSGLYAQRKTSIVDARLDAAGLTFATRRRYTRRLGDSSTMTDLVHRYDGRVDGDSIRFAVQVEGGSLEEVVAERVRDAAPGATLVSTLMGHDGAINRIVLLADGRIASASRDRTVRVWNLATGASEFELPHRDQVQAVVPTAAGTLLSVPDSGPIREWDLASGKPRREFEPLEGRALAVLPLADGLLTVSLTNDCIGIWDIASGRVARVVAAGQRMSVVLARLPDGTLACGDTDGGITLWDVAGDKLKRAVRPGKTGYGYAVSGLEALADGRLVYSVYKETNAFTWDPGTGREAAIKLVKPALWTQVLSTLPDGRLALVDGNMAIVLWDPRTGQSRAVVDIEREESGIGCVVSLPDGRLAVGMGNGPIKVWRPA